MQSATALWQAWNKLIVLEFYSSVDVAGDCPVLQYNSTAGKTTSCVWILQANKNRPGNNEQLNCLNSAAGTSRRFLKFPVQFLL